MLKSNFFHYRWILTDHDMGQDIYNLGRSNNTALSKGGICIGAFLLKDGKILNDKEDGTQAEQIVWAISRCSEKENYWKQKARNIVSGKAHKLREVLISKNYDYDTVKKIANKMAEVVNNQFHTMNRKEKMDGKFWEHIKNTFSIDSFVESGCQEKNVVIGAPSLMASGQQ